MTNTADSTQSPPAPKDAPKASSTPLDFEPVDWWRLIFVASLIAVGWLAAGLVLIFDAPVLPKEIGPNEAYPGLSPAIKVCYLFHSRTSPIIIAVAMGLGLGISYVFGTFLYKKFRETSSNERGLFWAAVSDNLAKYPNSELRDLVGAFREYENLILDKRNLYWSLFTRVSLAILVVGLIALLISTCKIESQAGLPIISGIIAFIIGQSAELTHSAGSTPIYVSPRDRTDGSQASKSEEVKTSSSEKS
jgi:hypothetical protein